MTNIRVKGWNKNRKHISQTIIELSYCKMIKYFFFFKISDFVCKIFNGRIELLLGEVTNTENIKADTPKILRPTHFSGPKDIKAEKWVVGVVPWNFFFPIGVVGANIWSIDFEGNKAENHKADKVT